jgi:hypothetical protein
VVLEVEIMSSLLQKIQGTREQEPLLLLVLVLKDRVPISSLLQEQQRDLVLLVWQVCLEIVGLDLNHFSLFRHHPDLPELLLLVNIQRGASVQRSSSRRLETKKWVREWLAMEIKELLGCNKAITPPQKALQGLSTP